MMDRGAGEGGERRGGDGICRGGWLVVVVVRSVVILGLGDCVIYGHSRSRPQPGSTLHEQRMADGRAGVLATAHEPSFPLQWFAGSQLPVCR